MRRGDQLKVKSPREAAGNLVLGLTETSASNIEPVGPQVRASLCIDQLHVDLNFVASAPQAAFDDISNAEITAELFHVDGFILLGKRGAPGDDKAPRNPRQISGEIVGNAVCEIFQFRIV